MHSTPNAGGDDIGHGHASPSHGDSLRVLQCGDNGRGNPRSRQNANASVQPLNSLIVMPVFLELLTRRPVDLR